MVRSDQFLDAIAYQEMEYIQVTYSLNKVFCIVDTGGEGKYSKYFYFPGCVGGRWVAINVSTHVPKTSELAAAA